eukprot:TRINITY_DN3364_c0_g1_i1.p1 TRINITY_DN3364_c0_g1~~TRINITY_DN3364_c0_g1_i1.p1  ORF type:complete len:2939 (+),score=366.03 TRINITY_DN3364_c0_g1_i1:184-9000(+)
MINKVRTQKPAPKAEKPERPSLAQYLPQKTGSKWAFTEPEGQKRHYFLGFHERLQRIDVKLAHNPDKIPLLDLGYEKMDIEEDLLTSRSSTFIEAVNTHNMMNSSTNYQEISRALVPMSTTFPMVVNNLDKIVDLILGKLGTVDQRCTEALLDFIIALIKDTRQLIFPIFLSKIMPKLISVVRIEEVEILDKIFTAFSYAFKFLQRQIMENLKQVYLCYYELLAHNNKYIRKFAAESFSYIVRVFKRPQLPWELTVLLDPLLNTQDYLELPETEEPQQTDFSMKNALERIRAEGKNQNATVEGIIDELLKKERVVNGNKLITARETGAIVIAISQLLAEVMEGTQGNPHSKAGDFLTGLLSMLNSKENIWVEIAYICRYSVILLIDYLDVDKDKMVYDSIANAFKGLFAKCFSTSGENIEEIEEIILNVVVLLWKEWIVLHNGRKISQYSVVQILQNINTLLCQNTRIFNQLSYLTQKNIIQCLGIIYSLKHQICAEIYQLSSPFPSKGTCNLLRKRLFELTSPRILYEFMKSLSTGYESVLRLNQFIGDYAFPPQCLKVVVPTEKQKVLYTPLYDNYTTSTFDLLRDNSADLSDVKARLLYVLNIANLLGKSVSLSKESSEGLLNLLAAKNTLWRYLNGTENIMVNNEDCELIEIGLFLDLLCKGNNLVTLDTASLVKIAKNALAKCEGNSQGQEEEMYEETMKEVMDVNFAFPQYTCTKEYFYVLCLSRVIKLLANVEGIKEELLEILKVAMQRHRVHSYLLEALESLLKSICNSTTFADETTHKISLDKASPSLISIHNFLQRNLSCNLKNVRLVSLRIMMTSYNDPSGLIRLLYKFEEAEVGLGTERDKAMSMRDMKLLLASGRVPKNILPCCVEIAFGSLWNKFTPLHKMAEDLLFSTMEAYEESRPDLIEQFLVLVRRMFNITAKYPATESIPYPAFNKADLTSEGDNFYEECKDIYVKKEDYTELRLFIQSLLKMFKRIVKLDPIVVGKVLPLFKEFIKAEYNKFFPDLRGLFSEKMTDIDPTDTYLLEEMKKVNIKDLSEELQSQLKSVAKSKMSGFMDVLAEAERLEKVSAEMLEMLNQVGLQMLASTDEKIQKNAVEIVAKTGGDYAANNLKLLQSLTQKVPNKDLLPSIDLSSVPPSEKPVLLLLQPIQGLLNAVLLLLYGKLVKKKGKRGKSHNRNMTNAIFGFISSLEKEDILLAVKVFMSKYQLPEGSGIGLALAKLPFNKMQGLCYTIKLIIKHLGRLVDDFVPYMGNLMIWILKLSLLYYSKEEDGIYKKTSHTIYSEAIKRLKDLYTQYNETDHLEEITKTFINLVQDKIANMKTELSQGKSNILSIFKIWSYNPKRLQKFFLIYPFILDSIFSLLTAPKLAPEVAGFVMQILYNLLFSDTENCVCAPYFESKIDFIVNCIHIYLQKQDVSHTARDSNTFAMLAELALYIKGSPTTVHKLIELLTPNVFLVAKLQKRGPEPFLHLLRTLKVLFEKYQESDKADFFHQFAPLLLRTKGCVLRHELASFLAILGKTESGIEKYANVALLMNTYTKNGMEFEPDFDIVIKEMNEFNAFLGSEDALAVPLKNLKVVLYHYLSSLSDEDYSVRSAATHGLKVFFSKKYTDSFQKPDAEDTKEFIIKDFIPTMRHIMKTKEDTIFRSVMDIFRSYLTASQGIPVPTVTQMHLDLAVLINVHDEEQDFFNNIAHTQMHRRFKALRAAAAAVADKKLTTETELKIMLPLADLFLFQEEDEEAMRKKVVAFKKSGYVRQAVADAIELIGTIVPHLSTVQYFGVINRYVIKLKKLGLYKEITQEVIVNVICKILEKFAFDVPDADSILEKEVDKNVEETPNVITIVRKLARENTQEAIDFEIRDLLNRLRRTVFPVLKNAMTESKKSREEQGERHHDIRPHVALALLRVAKKLGIRRYLEEYEKIVTILVGPLRSKDHELRDKVRTVLYEIVGMSSPYVLHIMLDELSTGLTRDYQRHILLYTIYGLFQRIVKTQKARYSAKVDYCLPLILPLIMKGVTGELAEEAETEEVVRQCKEAKHSKAGELYGLVAQLISVENSLEELIKPLVDELEITKNVKHIHKCELALGKISEGILKNQSLNDKTLISVCESMIEKGFALLEKKETEPQKTATIYKTLAEHRAENFLIQEGAASGKRVSLTLAKENKNEQLAGKAICLFGLSTLHSSISRQLLPLPGVMRKLEKAAAGDMAFGEEEKKESEPMVSETWIDNFVPYLVKALKTSYTQIVQVALRLYDKLLDQNVPKLQEKAPELLECVIKQFDYMNLSDKEMVHCVFRCMTRILETHHSTLSLSKSQIAALLALIKTNMREAERQISVFRFVRAIVNLKEHVKGILEIVDYVAELMVSAYNKNIREICGSIFLDYATKRIKVESQKFTDKIQFLLRNLSYEDDDSRLHLLEVMHKVLNYIVRNNQTKWIDTIFVTLVLRMANEDSSKCKKKIVEVIEEALKTSPRDTQKQMVGSVFLWLKEEGKPALKMVCFQLCGVVAKVWKDSFVPYLATTLDQVTEVLQKSVVQMNEDKELEMKKENEREEIHEEIKEVMKSVKLVEPEEDKRIGAEVKQDWMLCYMSLVCLEKLFEHIKGHLLNHLREKDAELMNQIAELLEHKHYWIKLLACRVIGHYFSDRDLDNVRESICFLRENRIKEIGMRLLGLFNSKYLDEPLATQATKNLLFIIKTFDESAEEEDVPRALLQKATNMGKSAISGPESEKVRLGFLVRLIGGIVLCMTEEVLAKELKLALSLVYRVATNERYKGSDTARLCNEIMNAVEGKVGVEKYTEGLNKLKADIQEKRIERKQKLKQIKLTNPEAAIKQKMKAKEKGKEKRRKKNMEWAIKRKGAVVPENSTTVRKRKVKTDQQLSFAIHVTHATSKLQYKIIYLSQLSIQRFFINNVSLLNDYYYQQRCSTNWHVIH